MEKWQLRAEKHVPRMKEETPDSRESVGIRNLLCRGLLPGTHQYLHTTVAIEIAVDALRGIAWE